MCHTRARALSETMTLPTDGLNPFVARSCWTHLGQSATASCVSCSERFCIVLLLR
jgi:hypothetical protein